MKIYNKLSEVHFGTITVNLESSLGARLRGNMYMREFNEMSRDWGDSMTIEIRGYNVNLSIEVV